MVYKPSGIAVVRMDHLPHLDSVSITKIGLFGNLYNDIYRIDDLERQDINVNYSMFEGLFKARKNIEPMYSYRHRKTNELFYFEKNGTWNYQGLSHPNLNSS